MKKISIRIFCTFFLASFLASSSTLAFGQVSTGTPPFGSFAGGPDVVNLGNLNVHWDIPIINKAGRAGMNFKYDATYDSSIWYPVGSSGNQSWQLAASLAPVMGWQGPNAGQPGSIQYSLQIDESSGPGYTCTAYIYTNWVYWDSFGNQHPFNLNVGSALVWQYGCSGGGNAQPALPWTGVTTDGSGYNINIVPSSPGCCDAPTLIATLVDKNGKTIGAPLMDGAPPLPPPLVGVDRNGNEITFSSSTSAFTDTLGTTALTLSGTAPSNTLLEYTAPTGTASYTVKYTALTVQTNFGCTGITEYPATSNNLVTEIDLPDQSVNANDKYTFTYETTPGDTHTPHYVTGRLTKVTLPTGGTISYTYTGGNNGIICSDGSAAGLTRTTPDGEWTYSRTLVSGNEWYTTVESPNDSQNSPSAPDYT
jgi:hypothetical protein